MCWLLCPAGPCYAELRRTELLTSRLYWRPAAQRTKPTAHPSTFINPVAFRPPPPTAQGSLAVDFAALQTLLMSALKQVHADTEELRRTQSAFQLMVLGRLETMAAAQQVAGGELEVLLRSGSGASEASGGSSGGSRAGASGAVAAAGGAAAAAGGGLPASPSLGQFLGPDEDYDMATSDSGEGSEEGAGSEAGEQADEGELRGMSEVQAAHWLMARLCEQAGAQKMYLVRG